MCLRVHVSKICLLRAHDQINNLLIRNECYPIPYWEEKETYVGSGPVIWMYDECEMQQEIMENGPISICFDVYDDFIDYSCGILNA